jgi:hypothetical protein
MANMRGSWFTEKNLVTGKALEVSVLKNRSVVRAVILLSSLLATGCASSIRPAEPELPFIELAKEKDGEGWRATWHLERPVRELVFERPANRFRREAFTVLTPGFSIEIDGDFEVLRTNAAPVRTISVRFDVYTRWLEKEYEFFRAFSDGSVAIYTGHLVARPGDTDDDCERCYVRRFRFIGPTGTPLVVDGDVHTSPMEWLDVRENGTYVYVGTIRPIETPEMISIVDPGLPDWLEEEARRALPRLFELYTDRFGVALPFRPTIMFNFVTSDRSGYSSGGGVLPGLIQLTVEGNKWTSRSDEAMLHLFHFLAHEAVHLWNGQVVSYPDTEDSWMHEGSADALAERTLLDVGLIDEERFLAYQTAALNECRRGIGSFPLREAGTREQFGLYYSCGNMIGLVTENAIESRDLFDFWRTLIARMIDSREYGADDYVATMVAMGAGTETIESLRSFVESIAEPEAIVEMISGTGVTVAEDDQPPTDYRHSASRSALLTLMKEHCRGRFGFNMTPDGLKLDDAIDCGSLPPGTVVTHIGGRHVMREGHLTLDQMHERCGTAKTVRLTVVSAAGGTSEIDLSCSEAVPARPLYLRIEAR